MSKFSKLEAGHALLLMLTVLSVFSYLIAFLFLLNSNERSGKEIDRGDGVISESCVPAPVAEICEVEGFERFAKTCSVALDRSQNDCLQERGFISALSGRIKYKSKTRDGCIVDTWCFKYCEREDGVCE